MQLTWHGHSTWRVETDGTAFLIDPWFDNPKTAYEHADIDPPDYILVTHGHFDHIAHVGKFPDATVVGTPEVIGYIEAEFGNEHTLGMNIGGTIETDNAYVTMHRSDHTNGLNSDHSLDAGMPTGYVISDTVPTQIADSDSESFYHAGDTGLMTAMRDIIGPFLEPDAAALPIGDHFTMGPMQAAIAVDWLNVDIAFPMHYDSFPPIEQDPGDFVREVEATGSDADIHVLSADEPFDLTDALQERPLS